MNSIVLGKGQLFVVFFCTRFVTGHLEKLVNALFPQGVSTFLQLVVAWLYLILEKEKNAFFSPSGTLQFIITLILYHNK